MIAAGDDFLIVARKELAMEFTLSVMKRYRELAEHKDILQKYRPTGDENRLTLSGSILYARAGFPFSVLSQMSAELEHSAKNLRKDLSDSCLDVYWLGSTARESAIQSRKRHLSYKIDTEVYSLNTRPWTISQAEAMHKAAAAIGGIPRGKWHQLLEGLKSGEPIASFHYQRWLQHLGGDHQRPFGDAIDFLTKCDPPLWSELNAPWVAQDGRRITPLLELHQLREASECSEEAALR
jgi:hypothetical protein